jgi:hypothetical protein
MSKALKNNPIIIGHNFQRGWASVLTVSVNGEKYILPLLPSSLSEDEKVPCRNEWKTRDSNKSTLA